ncbi:mitochondrial ribonuclease P catalytic subunit isoform X3 [Pithys albifrons albifrons]|uniref:mitochondrial ribonuclease P catalytic subunit isoform X3 n=1 Tax=Pithys albifrons albifrons TaxID=3385563 RepID=UPI003A5D11AC
MALFSQTRQRVFQALLWKCHMFWPVSRCQQLFAASFSIPNREKINYFSFITSSSAALPVDPQKCGVLTTKKRPEMDCEEEKRWDEESKEIPEGKLHFSSSVGAAKKWSMGQVGSRNKFMNIQPPEKPLQAEEWNKLRENFQSPEIFEEVMFNSMIRCNSHIDVAKSLLTHMAERNGDVAYNMLVKYLTLCVQQGQVSEICDVYDIMKVRFKILEIGAYNLLIKGLSNSDRWRMALTILEEAKKTMIPSRTSYESCMKAASRHKEMKLAFELYHEMLAKNVVPTLDVLQSFFDFSRGMKGAELQKKLFGILLYLRENQIYPHKTFMQSIKQWFESIPGGNWRGHLTTIKDSGQCPVCNHQLEDSDLTEEEYNSLSERIIRDVIHGTDTFRKTTPQDNGPLAAAAQGVIIIFTPSLRGYGCYGLSTVQHPLAPELITHCVNPRPGGGTGCSLRVHKWRVRRPRELLIRYRGAAGPQQEEITALYQTTAIICTNRNLRPFKLSWKIDFRLILLLMDSMSPT